ncbi:hypothetical protein FACS189497_14710 [Betaproteobacteria bacterium]|nr:hypothetical protein FACS189497_14710 [Betaproteobacteria bacterium]
MLVWHAEVYSQLLAEREANIKAARKAAAKSAWPMANKITIEYTGGEIIERLMRLSQAMSPTGLRTVLDQIGHDLTESTKRRFSTSTAPDGTPWVPTRDLAMASYLGTAKTNFKKDGTLSKRGEKRPLVALGTLARSITWQLVPEGGRLIALEKINTTITSATRYTWCGNSICQARDQNDQAIRYYFGEGSFRPEPKSPVTTMARMAS